MSPILTRPVREQFEHDRVIRLLEARYRRKFEVAINPGGEQNAPAPTPNGNAPLFPDLVLFSQERGRKLQGTIEVETGESINTLEAMSQWSAFAKLRAPFFLYVPTGAIDTVRRLCSDHEIPVAEIWTYHSAFDQVRFTMVHRSQAFAADSRNAKALLDEDEEQGADPSSSASGAAPGSPAPVTVAQPEPVEEVPAPLAPAVPARARKGPAKPAATPTAAATAPKTPPKKGAAPGSSAPPARSSTRVPSSARAAAPAPARPARTAPARGTARPAARKAVPPTVKSTKRR